MIIREVQLADVAGLALLHAACFDDAWSADSIRSSLDIDGALAFIALDDNQPVGFVLLRAVLDEAEILTIATHSDMRRKGVAKQLLDKSVKKFRSQGGMSLFLEVGEKNQAAQSLYDAYGFSQIGRRKGYYQRKDGPEDAITMAYTVV